ncbi:MAG TPA: TPM domain-containing protein [Pseudomonadales bacterium]|nr:TPM domain-containing protein [Pseudomonadales bacterium]
MRGFALLAALLVAALAHATDFPALSGRVVDAANILTPATRAELTQQLDAFEQRSGIQLVVATVPNLDGLDIETYGVDLARAWQIGSKAKNDGALLLVAKAEHKVRIEVGYGLEGDLTDAMSSYIISTRIVPQFRKGDFDAGVRDGVSGIIEVLGNPQQAARATPKQHARAAPVGIFWLIVLFIVISGFGGRRGGGGGLARAIFWGSVLNGMSSGRGRGGFGGGGFGGGGFSGGGGSFGGGGASGSW